MSISDGESVRGQYNWSNASPSMAVIDALAAIEDVKPINLQRTLDTTLYEEVNPDALDSLVTNDGHVTISFTIDQYRVLIDGNKLVVTFD